jgi:uncharacterized membrane protein
MKNMKYPAIAAGVTFLFGLVISIFAANAADAMIGKFALALSIFGFGLITTIYLMRQATAALGLREEDFHWH